MPCSSSDPVPPPLTNSSGAIRVTASTMAPRRWSSSSPDRRCIQRMTASPDPVASPCPAIWASYIIKPDEAEARAVGDESCEVRDLGGLVDGRAEDTDVPEAGRAPRRVGVDRDADLGTPGRRNERVDEIELCDVVDHERHPRGGELVGGETPKRGAVDTRVAQDHVVMRLGEPERLGEREGEDAAVSGKRERRVDDLADADRLARDADRHAAGADGHVEGVVAQSSQIHGGDRSGDVGDSGRHRGPVLRGARPWRGPGTVRVPSAGRGSCRVPLARAIGTHAVQPKAPSREFAVLRGR